MENYSNKKHCSCDKCEQNKKDEKQKEVVNHCKGCICDQLRHLQMNTTVNVYLAGFNELGALVFLSLDEETCCALFSDPAVPGTVVIVDCRSIQAIRIA
ncbi:hydrolase [Sporosarcina sp. E16_8]|uniref:hydrolase n=1 Tax=Sporosarcina sp. E16_8 TaxID=2789295 RepID=UPI001A9192B4|nr:hydrolase [Sporosarcina sp. E16_8]MBO0586334.1 hydrolase [Sporosarcina sp. E16_8]